MVDLTFTEGPKLSVDVLDLQALSTPSALAADGLAALGKRDCEEEQEVSCAILSVQIVVG